MSLCGVSAHQPFRIAAFIVTHLGCAVWALVPVASILVGCPLVVGIPASPPIVSPSLVESAKKNYGTVKAKEEQTEIEETELKARIRRRRTRFHSFQERVEGKFAFSEIHITVAAGRGEEGGTVETVRRNSDNSPVTSKPMYVSDEFSFRPYLTL